MSWLLFFQIAMLMFIAALLAMAVRGDGKGK